MKILDVGFPFPVGKGTLAPPPQAAAPPSLPVLGAYSRRCPWPGRPIDPTWLLGVAGGKSGPLLPEDGVGKI